MKKQSGTRAKRQGSNKTKSKEGSLRQKKDGFPVIGISSSEEGPEARLHEVPARQEGEG